MENNETKYHLHQIGLAVCVYRQVEVSRCSDGYWRTCPPNASKDELSKIVRGILSGLKIEYVELGEKLNKLAEYRRWGLVGGVARKKEIEERMSH